MCRIYSSEVLEHMADENISDVHFMWSNEEYGDVRKISIFKTLYSKITSSQKNIWI